MKLLVLLSTALFVSFSMVPFSASRAFADCTTTDQSSMNTCIGDAIDNCQIEAATGCVRQIDEPQDIAGRTLEACCCKGTGIKASAGFFNGCKTSRLSRLTSAKSVFATEYYKAVRKGIAALKFANCSELTCEE